tara:strand:+ start:76 stop:603 length:528 start_codon:yes stop_codon:yes gene_type:complete
MRILIILLSLFLFACTEDETGKRGTVLYILKENPYWAGSFRDGYSDYEYEDATYTFFKDGNIVESYDRNTSNNCYSHYTIPNSSYEIIENTKYRLKLKTSLGEEILIVIYRGTTDWTNIAFPLSISVSCVDININTICTETIDEIQDLKLSTPMSFQEQQEKIKNITLEGNRNEC